MEQYKYVTSGIVFFDNNTEYVDIPVSDGSTNFTIHMSNKQDAERKESRIEFKAVPDSIIDFHIINFNTRSGIGTNAAFRIGSAGSTEFFVHVWSYLLGEKDKPVWKIEFSIYSRSIMGQQ